MFVCRFHPDKIIGQFMKDTFNPSDIYWDAAIFEAAQAWPDLSANEVELKVLQQGAVMSNEAYQVGRGSVHVAQWVPDTRRRRIKMECPTCRHSVVWRWERIENLFSKIAEPNSQKVCRIPV